MFATLRSRFILIAILIAASGLSLWHNYQRTKGPNRPGQLVNLGLDLQGGMHLALELDQRDHVSADPSKDIDASLAVLRRRIDQLGVIEPLTQKVGDDRIVVELPGLTEPERAKEIVHRSAFLEFRITDETNALERALPSMDRVARGLGITGGRRPDGPVERLLGDSSSPSADPGGFFSASIRSSAAAGVQPMPGEYAVLESEWERVDSLLKVPDVARLLPRGVELRWAADSVRANGTGYRQVYALEDRAIITGSNLEDAQARIDPLTNGAEVSFSLDRAGGRAFGDATGRHVGDYLAIVLDGRVQGRPPVIQSRIEREGRIQMTGKPLQEAQDLALVLRAGALPTPLKVVEEQQVGPTLGQDSIRGGILAGLVGTGLVILMTIGYYAWSGVLAVAALLLYSLFTFSALAMFGATLTMPGLAGFVLSIGIAIDANVLIFERIREELAAGRAVRTAVEAGFKHAMPAIIDSNLTTVLTALFLFQFGTGPVKGFAVTLIVGIFASMITAVFVTRTLYLAWLRFRPEAKTLSIGKLRFFEHAQFDFIGARRKAYLVTALILATGIGFIATRGIESSVEFTGGMMAHVKTHQPVNEGALRSGLAEHGIEGAELQRFGSANEFLVRVGLQGTDAERETTQATTSAVRSALDGVLGAQQFTIERAEVVGPKVGGELRTQAIIAIGLSFLATLAYLAFRFEWRFGLAAVIATAHDILATIAFIAVMKLEMSLVIVAAILTVVGYSLNDTIVIFDRVRENLRSAARSDFAGLLNRSVNETLPRTVLTGGTGLASLIALAIFGGEVIRPFALVMFFGIFTGTFSSIFIAAPVLLWIEKRWPGTGARETRKPVPALATRAAAPEAEPAPT